MGAGQTDARRLQPLMGFAEQVLPFAGVRIDDQDGFSGNGTIFRHIAPNSTGAGSVPN